MGRINSWQNTALSPKKFSRMHEGRPNIVDGIKNKEIQLVINTPVVKLSTYDDSYIRKAAIKFKVPYITTLAAAIAASQRHYAIPEREEPVSAPSKITTRRFIR